MISLKNIVQIFKTTDITSDMIKDYKKYYLDRERGVFIIFIAKITTFIERLRQTPFSIIGQCVKIIF